MVFLQILLFLPCTDGSLLPLVGRLVIGKHVLVIRHFRYILVIRHLPGVHFDRQILFLHHLVLGAVISLKSLARLIGGRIALINE